MFNPAIETSQNTADFGGVQYPVNRTPVSHFEWEGDPDYFDSIVEAGYDPYGRPYFLGVW